MHLQTAGSVSGAAGPIPANSYARGTVVASKRAGRVKGRSQLEVRVDYITLVGGKLLQMPANSTTIEVRPAWQRPGAGRSSPVPGLIGMAAGYGGAMIAARHANSSESVARAGALTGLSVGIAVGIFPRGEDLVLRAGTLLEVPLEGGTGQIQRDLDIGRAISR